SASLALLTRRRYTVRTFFLCYHVSSRALLSFPTRRSSDLQGDQEPMRSIEQSGATVEDATRLALAALGAAPLSRSSTSISTSSRSEEHTSELQSLTNLVCRLLLEKKTTQRLNHYTAMRSPA